MNAAKNLLIILVLGTALVWLVSVLPAPTPVAPAAVTQQPQVWQATQAAEAMQATSWAAGIQATQAAAELQADLYRLEFQTQTLPYKYGLAALVLLGILGIIGYAVIEMVTAKATKVRYIPTDEGVLLGKKQVVIPALSLAPVIEKDKATGKMQLSGLPTDESLQLEVTKSRGNARIAGKLPSPVNNNFTGQQGTTEPITIEYLEHTGQHTANIIDEVEGKLLEG